MPGWKPALQLVDGVTVAGLSAPRRPPRGSLEFRPADALPRRTWDDTSTRGVGRRVVDRRRASSSPPPQSDRAGGGRRRPPKRGRARSKRSPNRTAPAGGGDALRNEGEPGPRGRPQRGPSARRSPCLIRSLVVKTLALRDLRTHPQEAHGREETLLTANNGRPVAVLLPVDAGTVDETLKVVRRARGLEALRAIRRESQSSGAARMTPADIDALVTRTRRSRQV